eukprot:scaffold21.g2104.t1
MPLRARRAVAVRAEGPTPPPPASEDDDARVEALEAAVRARRGPKPQQGGTQKPAAGRKEFADWKEGSLLPEGWDQMDPLEKVRAHFLIRADVRASNLYMGKRGFLYWANLAALWSIGGLIVSWICFRFVGPALGLYQLADDLGPPSGF